MPYSQYRNIPLSAGLILDSLYRIGIPLRIVEEVIIESQYSVSYYGKPFATIEWVNDLKPKFTFDGQGADTYNKLDQSKIGPTNPESFDANEDAICQDQGIDRGIEIFSEIVESNGLTIRQNNLNIQHGVPVGTKVRVEAWEQSLSLYVVHHARDCDGTPLYTLSLEKDAWINYKRNEATIKDRPDALTKALAIWSEGLAQGVMQSGYSADQFTLIDYLDGVENKSHTWQVDSDSKEKSFVTFDVATSQEMASNYLRTKVKPVAKD